ncbi:hypothetical protein QBC41DRAFT_329127 [Cercophora samala]|uniref:C2H2-type domain-containing protein n=1 Tax=Cercophora samala TaxID=330535 RepID=A0AA39Z3J0_9PEZI|nr:hypothetical protein QBC41DRAFT_329127 [Cercophora samala]
MMPCMTESSSIRLSVLLPLDSLTAAPDTQDLQSEMDIAYENAGTWAPWNLKKMGRLPPTPSSTPDSAAMQHRQSTSIDSAVVLEDTASMYGASAREKSPPATPRSPSRFSAFHFSPERPSSPVSTQSSPGSESDESNEWDHICIGHKGSQDVSVNEIQRGVGAVSLMSPAGAAEAELDLNEVDYQTDATVEPDNDTVAAEEADHILQFSLPTLRGINSSDVPAEVLEVCKGVTYAYAERIAAIVDSFEDLSGVLGEADIPSSGSVGCPSQRQSSSQLADKSTGKGKAKLNPNKKRRLTDEENDEDGEDDSGSIMGDLKDLGEERNLTASKLRCIFRARNPTRFNVRDHTSCAMTMFTKFSDLRKHILNKHMAESEIVTCQRCKRGFPSRNALELHCERELCNYKRSDPEDGINSETASRIRFRGRDCGPSDEEQWNHLWELAFPEDPHSKIEPFHFVPVLEHHELEPAFLQKLEYLKPVVQSYVPDEEQFEGLCVIIKSLFESAVHDLTHIGLKMDYVNRQGNRTNNRTSRPSARVLWSNVHDRDSGIGLDSSETGTPKPSGRYSAVTLETAAAQRQQDRASCSSVGSLIESRPPTFHVRSRLGVTCLSSHQRLQPNTAVDSTQTGSRLGGVNADYATSHSIPASTSSVDATPGLIYFPTTVTNIAANDPTSRFFHYGEDPTIHGTIHSDPAQLQFGYQQPQLHDVNAIMNNGILGYIPPATMSPLTGTTSETGKWI